KCKMFFVRRPDCAVLVSAPGVVHQSIQRVAHDACLRVNHLSSALEWPRQHLSARIRTVKTKASAIRDRLGFTLHGMDQLQPVRFIDIPIVAEASCAKR